MASDLELSLGLVAAVVDEHSVGVDGSTGVSTSQNVTHDRTRPPTVRDSRAVGRTESPWGAVGSQILGRPTLHREPPPEAAPPRHATPRHATPRHATPPDCPRTAQGKRVVATTRPAKLTDGQSGGLGPSRRPATRVHPRRRPAEDR